MLFLSNLLYCLKNNILKRMIKSGYLTLDHKFINKTFSGIKLSFFSFFRISGIRIVLRDVEAVHRSFFK